MSTSSEATRLAPPSRVVRLVLEREEQRLTLRLSLTAEDSRAAVNLRFVDVSDLRFRGERTELTEIVVLMVVDRISDGWSTGRFHVKDYEEEFISFICADVERDDEA